MTHDALDLLPRLHQIATQVVPILDVQNRQLRHALTAILVALIRVVLNLPLKPH